MRCGCFKYTSKAAGGESKAALLSGLATRAAISAEATSAAAGAPRPEQEEAQAMQREQRVVIKALLPAQSRLVLSPLI